MITVGGYRWISDSAAHGDNLGPDPHEAALEPILRQLLGNGVFVDVGAHVGHWTVRLAGQAAKVIAIEPNPAAVAVLTKNIELNEFKNVEVVEAAAWDTVARFRLEDPHGQIRGGSMRVIPSSTGSVQGFPLDYILIHEPAVTLIKLDVEGSDLHAIRGLKRTLNTLKPVLFIEDHSVLGYFKSADLKNLLAECNYTWRLGGTYAGADYLIGEHNG